MTKENSSNNNNSSNLPSILTEKDKLILKELLNDGRKTSASISKDIDLGREIINYRIKRLVKENLIVKFVPKLREGSGSYQEYVILLKLKLEDVISKEQFIKNTIGNKYLVWILKSNEGWDLIVKLYALNVEEFQTKLAEILEIFSEVLAKYYTILSANPIKEAQREILLESVFQDSIQDDFQTIKNVEMNFKIDDTDKELLELLSADGRVQYKDMAEKLHVSADTVKYRIEKLKQQGLIERFEPVINFSKLGFLQYALIMKCGYLPTEKLEQLKLYISKHQHIIRAIKNTYSDEFFMTLICEEANFKQMFEEEIRSLCTNAEFEFEWFEMN
ncbi:MAG: winged helix-turn-helix transcriptional regulator [Candidatus Woesearchaeota archaeon]